VVEEDAVLALRPTADSRAAAADRRGAAAAAAAAAATAAAAAARRMADRALPPGLRCFRGRRFRRRRFALALRNHP